MEDVDVIHYDPADTDINIEVYLHLVTCDECTAKWGDEAIALYGNALLTIVTIANL